MLVASCKDLFHQTKKTRLRHICNVLILVIAAIIIIIIVTITHRYPVDCSF